MKFSYKFSNLLGTIYRRGNLTFTPDGNSVISPVGNKITIFDLKNNKAKTLPIQNTYNYTCIALSPNGTILFAVNEFGQAHMISMISCTIIYTHKFKTSIQQIKFSPNGKYFAVARENALLVYKCPGEITGIYNAFELEKTFTGAYDDITWIDWSADSRFLALGSKNNTTRICGLQRSKNFRAYILNGHTDSIVGCFFEENSLHLNTISRNGQLCLWECSMNLSDIEESNTGNISTNKFAKRSKNTKGNSSESDDDIDISNSLEKTKEELEEMQRKNAEDLDKIDNNNDKSNKLHPFYYKKLGRHYLQNEPRKEHRNVILTAANYHSKSKLLVVAFSCGSFYLYELPDVNMIHSLSISNYPIASVSFNVTGDWISLASSEMGQLLVWEWQSEQYIMKQQGHLSEMNCISYSPDGQYIATGGEDSKVKLWNVNNGFCFVTFNEHTSSITGVEFSKNKKFLVSSSLDGTVRAFDIIRYRNFRTFTSPEPVQFACVALDNSGELVAAGGQDVYEIYLWSIKLGKLLEIISSHEGPVCSIAFSPSPISSALVSGSWDKTIKIWNCLENDSQHETIELTADVTCIAFKPNGEEVAVAILNGSITFFEVKTGDQVHSIEGRTDLGSGVLDSDVVSSKKNLESKSFTTLVYSADGECILAGGKSQFICIYHIREGILLKKFEITQNKSLDGMQEYINRRFLTEFGNSKLIEERDKYEGGNVEIRLPGVLKGNMTSRNYKPEIRVFSVRFSPTGQQWAAATTEGLMIYSLDKGVVFDPFNLSMEVTPKSTRECLNKKEYLGALVMAIKLNESDLIQCVLEAIPKRDVELISASLSNEYAQRTLDNVSKLLITTPHVEFYLTWSCCLLSHHGNKNNVFQHQTLLSLHDSLSRKYEMLNKICDFNKYTLKILTNLPNKSMKPLNNGENNDSNDEDMILIQQSNHHQLNIEQNSDSSMHNDTDSD